jgi:hypothetical protein
MDDNVKASDEVEIEVKPATQEDVTEDLDIPNAENQVESDTQDSEPEAPEKWEGGDAGDGVVIGVDPASAEPEPEVPDPGEKSNPAEAKQLPAEKEQLPAEKEPPAAGYDKSPVAGRAGPNKLREQYIRNNS